MSNTMNIQDEKLMRCFEAVFPSLSPEQIRTATPETVADWNSLSAITLVAVIERGIQNQNRSDGSRRIGFLRILSGIPFQSIFDKPHGQPIMVGPRKPGKERVLKGIVNRLLQQLARWMPGATSLRVKLHRARGINIGTGVWIGYDVILETSQPQLITLGDRCSLGARVMVIAHFRETHGVTIEEDAFIGPGAIILPDVVIGRGAVVTAGSVVTRSVKPMTVVQGNPAVPIAACGIPLKPGLTVKEFSANLRPLPSVRNKTRREDIA